MDRCVDSELVCCTCCRHVDVRTGPQNCYVFTLRSHPAVQLGTIAFNAPQVSALFSSLFGQPCCYSVILHRDVKFVYFQIRTSFVKFKFYLNFV